MEHMQGKTGRSGLSVAGYIFIGGALLAVALIVGILVERLRPTGEVVALPGQDGTTSSLPYFLPEEPDVVLLATPKPTFTPAQPVTQTMLLLTPELSLEPTPPEAATPLPTSTPSQPVRFIIQEETILYEGPGNAYAQLGVVSKDVALQVGGRTPNGIWWVVCCVGQEWGWMQLDGRNVLAEGDVNDITMYEVTVYHNPRPTQSNAPAPPANAAVLPGAAVGSLPSGSAPPIPSPPVLALAPPSPTAIPSRPEPTAIPSNPGCAIPGSTFHVLPVIGEPAPMPPSVNPEFNIGLRGYTQTTRYALDLWGYPGEIDPHAPRLQTLFQDERVPQIRANYQVREWNWDCNCQGAPLEYPESTLSGFATSPGEVIRAPDRPGGDIGGDFRALVLHADSNNITLKYTREDNILYGYAIHIENICVDPNLLALYQRLDREGRTSLPALVGGQAIGHASADELRVAVRDSGAFMDPRSRKDWWQGK